MLSPVIALKEFLVTSSTSHLTLVSGTAFKICDTDSHVIEPFIEFLGNKELGN